MSFAGNLKTVSFGDTLQLISTGKKTGALHLDRPQRGKKIYFRDGDITAALSNIPTDEERLGQMLLRRGLINPLELERALKRQKSTHRKLGQVLTDLGVIDRDTLTAVLRAQVEEIVYGVFGWTDGEFHFVEGEKPLEHQILVELNTLNVMMEGARRYDEYAQIADALPDDSTVLRLIPVPDLPNGEVTLAAEDFEVLASIDGDRTVGEIVGGSLHGEYTASKSLHRILTTELAEPCPEKADAARTRDSESDVCALVYRLFSRALGTVHKALTDQYGVAGDRVFLKIPNGYKDDRWGVVDALIDEERPDGAKRFQEIAKEIPPPIRMHRLLGLSTRVLDDAVCSLKDRLGTRRAKIVIDGIEKELTFLLAQKRGLADTYDIKPEFTRALRGTIK